MKIHITIPTLDRERLIALTLESIKNSNFNGELKAWVIVDGTREYFQRLKKWRGSNVRVFWNQNRKDWIWSTNYLLENFLTDGYVLYGADDIEFRPGCIQSALNLHLEKFPDGDGIVGFNQINCKGSQSAFGLMGQKFINRFRDRQVFCPDYIHFCSDTELGRYARKIGKFAFCESAEIKHFRGRDITRWTGDKLKPIDLPIMELRKVKGLLWGESFELIGGNRETKITKQGE